MKHIMVHHADSLCTVQGLSVFTKVLEWFQNQNNWAGWGIFLAMYTANVSLLLPGIVLILGAGFIFGFASVLFWHYSALGNYKRL